MIDPFLSEIFEDSMDKVALYKTQARIAALILKRCKQSVSRHQ